MIRCTPNKNEIDYCKNLFAGMDYEQAYRKAYKAERCSSEWIERKVIALNDRPIINALMDKFSPEHEEYISNKEPFRIMLFDSFSKGYKELEFEVDVPCLGCSLEELISVLSGSTLFLKTKDTTPKKSA